MGVSPANTQLPGTGSGLNTNSASPAQAEITFGAQNISLHRSDMYFQSKEMQGSLKSNVDLEEDGT